MEPLPADVPIVPMNAEPEPAPPPPQKKRNAPKPKPEPYTGPTTPYVFKVKNALGAETEVVVNVRADKRPESYNGVAVTMAGRLIHNVKPFVVLERRLKE